jgi:predicted nucleic acid-binding protein
LTLLLDTNVLSEMRKSAAGDRNFRRWSVSADRSAFHTSVLAVAELRRGAALKHRRHPTQGAMLDAWVDLILQEFAGRILNVDQRVAETWASLSVPDPLPAIDGLIAATAIVHGLTLVTRNERDFARIGVRLLNPWTAPA